MGQPGRIPAGKGAEKIILLPFLTFFFKLFLLCFVGFELGGASPAPLSIHTVGGYVYIRQRDKFVEDGDWNITVHLSGFLHALLLVHMLLSSDTSPYFTTVPLFL